MKKIIGGILTLLGALLLVVGVVGLFGTNWLQGNPWIFTILGAVFFIAGIMLLKTIRSVEGGDNSNRM
ncbi:MAG: hypothetical protein ACXWDO_02775 [Bacteroidia bacterium]